MQQHTAEILNNPSDILALLETTSLNIEACNKTFYQYFVTSEDNAKGRSIFDVLGIKVPHEKQQKIIEQIKQQLIYSDSTLLPNHHLYFNLISNGNSNALLFRVSSHLQDNALDQYKHLFDKNLAGIYKATTDGKIISCNKAFAEIVGYQNTAELIGTNAINLYKHPRNRKDFLKELRMHAQILNYEMEVMRKDNSTAICLENAYLEKSFDGQELVSGILIDITEKKRIEQELKDSEVRYKSLASVSGESVAFVNDGVVIDCNEQFSLLFGYENGAEVIGKELNKFLDSKDIKRILTTLNISDLNKIEARTFTSQDQPVFLEVRGKQIIYKGRNTQVLVINDITARKKAEHMLEQSVLRFRNLLENSPNGVIILTDGNIRYLNHAACMLLAVEDEDEIFDHPFINFVSTADKEELVLDLNHIRNGGEVDYKEIKLLTAENKVLDAGIKTTLTVYENKPSLQITLTNLSDRKQLYQEQVRVRLIEEINTVLKTEIEEHKKTQQKLKHQQREALEQKAKLESIINSTENFMMWTMDSKYRITTMNTNFGMWMTANFSETVAIGKDIIKVLRTHLDPDHNQGQLEAFSDAFVGKPQQVEIALKDKENQTMWLQAFLNPVYMDDKLEQISCLMYDNTERRQIDRLVLDSLKEKEVLLQEVHHRVKNNLQIISSILNLQSSYVSDQATLDILQESQQRIKSMSFIHETLYRTADFNKLEFTQYINTIVTNLVRTYSTSHTSVELIADLDDIYLSLDQSIPCGLIVNELVSNAMKYAWKGKKKGKLKATLKEKPEDLVCITIADDGVGLPKDFQYDKTDSLGIQLVYTLVEQLDAILKVNSSAKGTSFNIEFKRVV
jgi:PAS domain S-box-containing protein